MLRYNKEKGVIRVSEEFDLASFEISMVIRQMESVILRGC